MSLQITFLDGRNCWLVDVDGQQICLPDGYEGANMSDKLKFAQEMRTAVANFAQAAEQLKSLQSIYDHRGYGAGGANAIANDDIAAAGITADELYSAVIYAGQVVSLRETGAITGGDYHATVDKVRGDL